PGRSFLSSSACGVCGATTVADLARDFSVIGPGPRVDPALLLGLGRRLRARQSLFESTGGLHAAGLFTIAGEEVTVREDVGRPNAWRLRRHLSPDPSPASWGGEPRPCGTPPPYVTSATSGSGGTGAIRGS